MMTTDKGRARSFTALPPCPTSDFQVIYTAAGKAKQLNATRGQTECWAAGRERGAFACLSFVVMFDRGRQGHWALLCSRKAWREVKASQFLKTSSFWLFPTSFINVFIIVWMLRDHWVRSLYLRMSSRGLDSALWSWCQKHCAELKWTMIISIFFSFPIWYLPLSLGGFFLCSVKSKT